MLPSPGDAADRHVTTHQLREPARDRQAQAGSAEAPRRRAVGLRERLEQACARGLVHADSAVADGDADQHGATRLRVAGGADADEPVIGELDGVTDQIEQDLAHPHRVPGHPVRPARRAIDEQRQTLPQRLWPHRFDRSIDQIADAEGQPLDVHAPGVYF